MDLTQAIGNFFLVNARWISNCKVLLLQIKQKVM